MDAGEQQMKPFILVSGTTVRAGQRPERVATRSPHTEENDVAFRMETLNSASPQLHGVSGE
jgi:hypothetical protein